MAALMISSQPPDQSLRVLTWHVHGSYLYYLVQSHHHFFLPVKPDRPEGYGGRSGSFPWPDNVHEIPFEEVKDLEFDILLFQSRKNYLTDQYEILSEAQHSLPSIYLEHDPPQEHPTNTRHIVDDENVLLVHVTYFNDLMWDNGRTPTRVIPHGVMVPQNIQYTGEFDKGIVVVNNLQSRGRRLGKDIYERVQSQVPLNLVGMNSKLLGGVGEMSHHGLLEYEARHRFFFNPIRYTSLGLAVCEAMMLGLPVVGLATTEMVKAVENRVAGYLDNDIPRLVEVMSDLLNEPEEAKRLGMGARQQALEQYNIERFINDWNQVFELVTGRKTSQQVFSITV